MPREEGLDWLVEENRFLRAKLQEVERNHRTDPNLRRQELPGIPPGRKAEVAGADDAASSRSTLCHHCARMGEALQTLRDSERRLRTIFEASPDGIILIDDQMRLVEANQGAEKIFGLLRRELVGRSIADFLHAGFDREVTWACFIDAREYSGEDSIRRPDGRVSEVKVFGRAGIEPGRHVFFVHEIPEGKRMGSLVPGLPFLESREALV